MGTYHFAVFLPLFILFKFVDVLGILLKDCGFGVKHCILFSYFNIASYFWKDLKKIYPEHFFFKKSFLHFST